MFSEIEKQALDEAGKLQDEWELNECKLALLQAFPEIRVCLFQPKRKRPRHGINE